MTTEKITMPQLGESVTEGTISTWLVKEGDHVEKYDPIVEVMTDKVNAEVPSSFAGTIKEIVAKEGDTVVVGEIICYLTTDQKPENDQQVEQETESLQLNIDNDVQKIEGESEIKKRYSPAVLQLAQQHQIDLNQIEGTGRGGRITRKDIEKVIASGQIQKTNKAAQETIAVSSPKQRSVKMEQHANPTTQTGDIEIPVAGVRKIIAQNMVRSKTEIPHAWMMVEVDVTNLVSFRNDVKTKFKQQEGYNLTFFAFFIKAVAQALKEFPQLNSMWAGDKIIQKKDVHISIAVANEQELFVPVIRHADEKSIKGIAKDIYELANKARTGQLTADDMQGGTFTVNNTGSFGSVQSMGVINYPQAAILQVESIVKRPVIINDMFAARDMVNLCLSLDHRILDGLVCGNFLARVKAILENMNKETISIY